MENMMVAGSRMRKELSVAASIDVSGPSESHGQLPCAICQQAIGVDAEGREFVPCECAYRICRPCYEYIRAHEGNRCPQCLSKYRRLAGKPPPFPSSSLLLLSVLMILSTNFQSEARYTCLSTLLLPFPSPPAPSLLALLNPDLSATNVPSLFLAPMPSHRMSCPRAAVCRVMHLVRAGSPPVDDDPPEEVIRHLEESIPDAPHPCPLLRAAAAGLAGRATHVAGATAGAAAAGAAGVAEGGPSTAIIPVHDTATSAGGLGGGDGGLSVMPNDVLPHVLLCATPPSASAATLLPIRPRCRVDDTRRPLSRKVPVPSSMLNPYRFAVVVRFVVMILFFKFRVTNPNNSAFLLWLASVICEIWSVWNLLDIRPAAQVVAHHSRDLPQPPLPQWTWLFLIPLTIIIVNAFAILAGVAHTINNWQSTDSSISGYGHPIKAPTSNADQIGQLVGQVFFSVWVLLHLYPFTKPAMDARRVCTNLAALALVLLVATPDIISESGFQTTSAVPYRRELRKPQGPLQYNVQETMQLLQESASLVNRAAHLLHADASPLAPSFWLRPAAVAADSPAGKDARAGEARGGRKYYVNLVQTARALQNAVVLLRQKQRRLVMGQINNAMAAIDGVKVVLVPREDRQVLEHLNVARRFAEHAKLSFMGQEQRD
ncbi:unnamed protein product [Closterium sp. Naga37s-1]|nr:unnamed protein product [Closterium sp. Naga37s-1]